MNNLQMAQQIVSKMTQGQLQNASQSAPWAGAALQAIQTGNMQLGNELANNIIASYGYSSQEEAINACLQRYQGKR